MFSKNEVWLPRVRAVPRAGSNKKSSKRLVIRHVIIPTGIFFFLFWMMTPSHMASRRKYTFWLVTHPHEARLTMRVHSVLSINIPTVISHYAIKFRPYLTSTKVACLPRVDRGINISFQLRHNFILQ